MNLTDPNSFTIWIAIDKGQKNGSRVSFGSHKRLYPHTASFAPGSSQKVKEIEKLKNKFKIKSFNLNPGDCHYHSQIIHGSKNSSNNSRKGFTVQVMTSTSKVDKEKFKRYQESLKKQIELRAT